MATEPLEARITKVRATLETIEKELAVGDLPDAGLASFKLALDHLRMTTWAALTVMQARRSGATVDPSRRMAKFRVQRATEMCRGAMQDVEAGTIPADALEVAEFYAALADAAERIRAAIEGAD